MVSSDPAPLLIISSDVVGERMAGAGIRSYHLARVLGRHVPVILAVPPNSTLQSAPDFSVQVYQPGQDEALQAAINQARAVLVSAIWVTVVPEVLEGHTPLIIDGYNPFVAENLAAGWDINHHQNILPQAYLAGDFFICASERQRDWWLGLLEAHGRINQWTFEADPSLRSLLDVVPYGLPESTPRHTRPVIKDVWPGIRPQDKLLLWGGGLWRWLDPLTAIRAVARVWEERQDVRLVFPGTRHPNPTMETTPTHTEAARRLAGEFGLIDKAVFFGDWVPYADWTNVLLESDLALSLHYDMLETRLAFRSRMLEYIWAGLPIVATGGDATGELVEAYNLGLVVDYEDAAGVAAAILDLLDCPPAARQPHFEAARQALTWERAVEPLIDFCRNPTFAPDKGLAAGSPYYQARIAHLQATIDGYERGRFIRFMRWLRRG